MNRHYINNFILVVIILLSSTLLTGCAGYVMNLSSQSIQLSEQEAQSAYEGWDGKFPAHNTMNKILYGLKNFSRYS